jgi:hypothetical protein
MRLTKPIAATVAAATAATMIALAVASAPAQSPSGATTVVVDGSGGSGGTKTFPTHEQAARFVRSICDAQAGSGHCFPYTNDQGIEVVVLPSGLLVTLSPS